MVKKLLFILVLSLSSSLLYAQEESETPKDSTTVTASFEDEDDPFKESPFFSRPVHELLREPPKDWGNKEKVRQKKTYRKFDDSGVDFGDLFVRDVYSAPLIYAQYPVLPMVHYNRVNGLYLGVQQERMAWHDYDFLFDIPGISITGGLGYAFALEEWQYALGLEKRIGEREYVILGAEYHNQTTTDDYWRVGVNETSITALGAGYDFLDYYKLEGYGAYALFRTRRFVEFGITYNNDDYLNLEQQTDYAFFGSASTFRPNQDIDELNLKSVTLGASFNPNNLILSSVFSFNTNLLYEMADWDSFDNETEFRRVIAESELYFRLDRNTVWKTRLRAGHITGNAPLQRTFELGGVGSLRARPYKFLANNNQYLLGNSELQFGQSGWGDRWLDFSSFYLSLFLDSGWTQFNPDLVDGSSPFEGWGDFSLPDAFFDVGAGLGTSFARVEVAWRDANFESSPVVWIRFNPTF